MNESTRTRRANGQFETDWTPQEDAVLRDNIQFKTYRELAKLLPLRTRAAICWRAKLIGVRDAYIPDKNPIWSEGEIATLRANINRMPYSRLAEMLPGRSVGAIKRRANIVGQPRLGNSARAPRRSLDETFFSVVTLKSAYWAGFLAADGCVTDKPRHEVKFALHAKDRAEIERFVCDTGYDGAVRQQKQMCGVRICAAYRWLADLELNYNIGPKKTLALQPPNVSGQAALAYSIGLIDGDGCWAIHNRKHNRKALIVVGTKPVLEWLMTLWVKHGATIGNVNLSFKRNVWRLAISGTHAESVARLLNSIPVQRMERKWRVARGESFGQERSNLEQ